MVFYLIYSDRVPVWVPNFNHESKYRHYQITAWSAWSRMCLVGVVSGGLPRTPGFGWASSPGLGTVGVDSGSLPTSGQGSMSGGLPRAACIDKDSTCSFWIFLQLKK